jgi:hypothetical protein
VQARHESARQAVPTPAQARELFDELWRAQNEEEEFKLELPERKEDHFISIKTFGPDLQVSVAPAKQEPEEDEAENDHWGQSANM